MTIVSCTQAIRARQWVPDELALACHSCGVVFGPAPAAHAFANARTVTSLPPAHFARGVSVGKSRGKRVPPCSGNDRFVPRLTRRADLKPAEQLAAAAALLLGSDAGPQALRHHCRRCGLVFCVSDRLVSHPLAAISTAPHHMPPIASPTRR